MQDLVLEELSHNPDIGELLVAYPTRDDVQGASRTPRPLVPARRSLSHRLYKACNRRVILELTFNVVVENDHQG